MSPIGTFLGKWVIGKQIPGGILLHMEAMVTVAPHKKISGQVTTSQALPEYHPIHIDVTGKYVDFELGGKKVHIATIENVDSKLPGAPSLKLLAVFDDAWQSGTAWFHLVSGTLNLEENDAPVVVEK
jgi:hypothetical protein